MKRLYILRHAKSSWSDPELADFDRPLNERGQKAAPFIGEVIARRGFLPDAILSSPAKRAKQTALLVREAAGISAAIVFDERIYEASPQSLSQIVSEVDEENESVLIVGHNPGAEGFIRYLTGALESMPTTALAVIDLKIDRWRDVAPACGVLETIIRSKDEMKAAGTHGS